jgi:type I restriction enzyme, S subunit
LAKQLKKVDKGDVVITNTSENLEDVGKALVYLGELQAVTGGHASILKPGECLLGKYFAYFTQTEEFSGAKRKYAKGTKVIDVSATDMAKIQIPIPCPDDPKKSLEIQAEIVRILDAFTELTTELTTRKKQYNHYRDQLLRFEDGDVERMPLGSITTVKTGQAVNKQMIAANPGDYPVINSGRAPLGFINEWNTERDPIGITSRGAGVGSITWHDGKYFRGNLNYSVTIKNDQKVRTRYLYHILQKMQLDIQALCTYDGIPALNAGNLKELKIPAPSSAEQKKIEALLDKFDALTNSLTEGLPREIELRQKQYEHYRDLLLSFPRREGEMA